MRGCFTKMAAVAIVAIAIAGCASTADAARLRRSAAAVQVPGRLRRGSLALTDRCRRMRARTRRSRAPGGTTGSLVLRSGTRSPVRTVRPGRPGRSGPQGRRDRRASRGLRVRPAVRDRRCAGTAGSVGSVGRRESLKRRDAEARIGERERVPASCSPMLSSAAVAVRLGSRSRLDGSHRSARRRRTACARSCRAPARRARSRLATSSWRRDEDHWWLCPPQRA